MAHKNGKTEIAAGIALSRREEDAEIYGYAKDPDQDRLVYDVGCAHGAALAVPSQGAVRPAAELKAAPSSQNRWSAPAKAGVLSGRTNISHRESPQGLPDALASQAQARAGR